MRSSHPGQRTQWLKRLLITALLVAGGGLWMAANRDRADEIHRIPVAGSGQLVPSAINAASEPRALDSPDRYLPPTRPAGRSGGSELVLLDRALADLAKDLARDGRQVLLVGGPGGLSDAAAQRRCQSDAKRSLPVKQPLTRAAPQAIRFCHWAKAAERRSL